MVRLPPQVIEALERNHRRNQRGGVIEAVIGAGLGTAGLAGTLVKAHNGWYSNSSPTAMRKRLRDSLEPLDQAKKRLRTEDDKVPRVWDRTRTKVSLPDSTSTAQVAMGVDGKGSGTDSGLHETQLDDPFVVYRGPPDFTFASLPFMREEFQNWSNAWLYDNIYRMTSPYDCMHEATAQDINMGTGTTTTHTESVSDAVIRKARWFDYYSGLYKYYHVVSCRYSVRIENLSNEPIYVHKLFCNDTIPPVGATNEDIMLWSESETRYVCPIGIAIDTNGQAEIGYANDGVGFTNSNNETSNPAPSGQASYETTNHISHPGSSITTFTGEYRPGDFRREVRLDSEVENWTLCTTNPSLPERLVIRVKPVNSGISTNDANTYGDDIKYRIQTKLEYLVEFKELVDGLRWPVQRQPVTVTIAADVTSSN